MYIDFVTLRPKGSTHGNRCVSLSESQFLETQPKTRKASGLIACFKKGSQLNLLDELNLRNFLTLGILPKFDRVPFEIWPTSTKKTIIYKTFIHNLVKGHQHQAFKNNIIKKNNTRLNNYTEIRKILFYNSNIQEMT